MRTLLLIITVFHFQSVRAEGLPKHYNTESMGITEVPTGQRVPLNMTLKVPDGYKVTFSPKLNVYEKQGGKWVQTQTLKEKDFSFLRMNNEIRFTDHMAFTRNDSEVALDLSVSFCKKICVINNFQSTVKRQKKSNKKIVNINVKGFLPMEKVKPEFQKKGS